MVCPDSLNALGSTDPEGEDPPPLLLPPQLAGEPLSDALVVEAEGISSGLKPGTQKGRNMRAKAKGSNKNPIIWGVKTHNTSYRPRRLA